MPGRSELYVEGTDDQHVVLQLLKRHGVHAFQKKKAGEGISIGAPEPGGGVNQLLDLIETQIKAASGELAIGFVIDADADPGLRSRWQSIRDRLRSSGVDSGDQIPEEGFIGIVKETGLRVGVWLMPDNRREGLLETFLQDLIESKNALFEHAKAATEVAMGINQEMKEVARPKAEIHAWLAWQETPGLPYGLAIAKKYFTVDSPAALAFVAWCRRLYDLPEQSDPSTPDDQLS